MSKTQNPGHILSKVEILEVLEAAKLYFQNLDEPFIQAVRFTAIGSGSEPSFTGDEVKLHQGKDFIVSISKRAMD